MRGSPRMQETHLTVVGYDGADGKKDDRPKMHGGLMSGDAEKGGKRRGIMSMIKNFILIKLRYDPTTTLILLMVVVTVVFIVLGLIVLPILYGLNTEAKAEAKISVSGYDGVLGLKDVEEPDEKTAATLPKAANGDFRFMLNDQNYAISPYGGVYVANEDLEKPYIMPDGSYNPKNVRRFRYKPGRVTILPEAITQEELEFLTREGDGELQKKTNFTATDNVELSIAVFPNANAVHDRILKRIEPYVGLPPSFAQQWMYRVTQFDDAHDEDGKEVPPPEGVKKGKKPDDHEYLFDLIKAAKDPGPAKLRNDFINHDQMSRDTNRVVSGSIFLANDSPYLKKKDGLVGGSLLFPWDDYLALADATLLELSSRLPSFEEIELAQKTLEAHSQDMYDFHDVSLTGRIMKQMLSKSKFDDSKDFWHRMHKMCSMDRAMQKENFGKWYRQKLLEMTGAFLIKQQPRTIILYDNVWTKYMFKERQKQIPNRFAFNGICREQGIIKQFDIAYQDAERFASGYKRYIAEGKIKVNEQWL